jgi:predicted transposase YbfD/YdcC
MIVMALVAVLCGCDGWDDVAEFCQIRQDWFTGFLPRIKRIPSHDTFDRVFARIEPGHLERMLRTWMEALHIATGGKLLAIDGKSLRRSFEHAWDKSGMAHIVSVFATENGLVLGQVGVQDADNELTAIKQLLPAIDLHGSTVTIDALGCQREIAQQIVGGGGDYVLCVKNNQPVLLEKIKPLLDWAILEKMHAGLAWQPIAGDQRRARPNRNPQRLVYDRGRAPGPGPAEPMARPQGDRGGGTQTPGDRPEQEEGRLD